MSVSFAGRACLLRRWFGSDAEPLVPIANDPYIARYLSHVFPVLEKAGYTLEGRLRAGICDRRGMVHEELIYGRLRP